MTVQGVCNSFLLPSCSSFWVQKAKTASTHHIRSRISYSPLSALSLPFPLESTSICRFKLIFVRRWRRRQKQRRRRIIFLFASRVLLLPGSLRSLFSFFCCYLPPFVPCILGTVAVYAPLRFASCSLSFSTVAQAALRSQLFNCVCVCACG